MSMNLADLLIIILLAVTVVSAFAKGFFVEVCSLIGVILGLFIAAANYAGFAPWFLLVVRIHAQPNLMSVLRIVFLVMVVARLAGRLLQGLFRGVGLGIVGRLLGASFGFAEACV